MNLDDFLNKGTPVTPAILRAHPELQGQIASTLTVLSEHKSAAQIALLILLLSGVPKTQLMAILGESESKTDSRFDALCEVIATHIIQARQHSQS